MAGSNILESIKHCVAMGGVLVTEGLTPKLLSGFGCGTGAASTPSGGAGTPEIYTLKTYTLKT